MKSIKYAITLLLSINFTVNASQEDKKSKKRKAVVLSGIIADENNKTADTAHVNQKLKKANGFVVKTTNSLSVVTHISDIQKLIVNYAQEFAVDKTLTGHNKAVNSVAFSNDGKYLASGSNDHTIKIWDTTDYKLLHNLIGHTGGVISLAYSKDDKHLAGSEHNTIKIWDLSIGDCIQTLIGHTDKVNSAIYSPCGKYIASGSDDKTIKIWKNIALEYLAPLTMETKNNR